MSTKASWIARELLVQRAGDGRAAQARRRALLERFQGEEHDAGIRRDAEAADAQAGKGHGASTPGCFRPMSDMRRMTASVRSSDAAVGQLREGDEILLVLRRHEAGRHLVETPAGQQHQAAINHQRDGALAQHARRRRRSICSPAQANTRLNGRKNQPSALSIARANQSFGA